MLTLIYLRRINMLFMSASISILGIVCLIIIRFLPSNDIARIFMFYLLAISQFCFSCYILYGEYKKLRHKFRFGMDKIFDILVIITFQLFATQGINNFDLAIRSIIGITISSVATYCLLFKNV